MTKRHDDGNPVDRHIGRRLQSKREQRMLSLADCAAQLEMTSAHLAGCEAGRQRLQPGEMLRAARVLDVPVVYFFEGGERPAAVDDRHAAIARFLGMPGAQELAATFAAIESSAARDMIVSFASSILERETSGLDSSGSSSAASSAKAGREPPSAALAAG
jgi:transcriptional regulator with XRE-family HTH domain